MVRETLIFVASTIFCVGEMLAGPKNSSQNVTNYSKPNTINVEKSHPATVKNEDTNVFLKIYKNDKKLAIATYNKNSE